MKKIYAAFVALVVGLNANAAVQLTVDDYIKITAINGQAVSQSPFRPAQQRFTLEPGKHVITARYDRLFDLNARNHDYLKSANVTVSADLEDNQSYRLSFLDAPNDYHRAKEYAKAPTLAILRGNEVLTKQSVQETEGGILSGLGTLFGRSDQAVIDNQKTIGALHAPADTAARPANTLDSFMRLWLNASDEERAKIRQWIEQ